VLNFLRKPLRGAQPNIANPLRRGLQVAYLFNEYDGDRICDYSGNDNYGQPVDGAAWDAFGGIYCAPGSNPTQKIRTNKLAYTIPNLSTEGTFVCGFVRKADWGAYGAIFNVENLTNSSGNETCLWNNADVSLYFLPNFSQSSGVYWNYGNTPNNLFTVGKLYTIAATWNYGKSELAGYIDGVLTGSKTGTSWTLNNWATSGNYIYIGGSFAGTLQVSSSVVIFTYVFNRALSAVEIQQLHINPYIFFERPFRAVVEGGGGGFSAPFIID